MLALGESNPGPCGVRGRGVAFRGARLLKGLVRWFRTQMNKYSTEFNGLVSNILVRWFRTQMNKYSTEFNGLVVRTYWFAGSEHK